MSSRARWRRSRPIAFSRRASCTRRSRSSCCTPASARTSHDVAAYLEGLFPGLRDKARAEAAESLPVEVTDPTVPMMNMNVRGTDPDDNGASRW